MKRGNGIVLAGVAGILMAAVSLAVMGQGDPKGAVAVESKKGEAKFSEETPAKATAEKVAEKPKELSENVKNGIKWLVEHQGADGGWGQGEESAAMGAGMKGLAEKSNVGDTCVAVLALLRTGSTPLEGEYAEQIRKGIGFVCDEIEKSKEEGLSVTSVNGTRLQGKLGPNIDTFLSSLMLGEVRNKTKEENKKRVIAALDKVMDKIEKNTKADGTVAAGGWAGGIAQGIAVKAANKAAESGAKVSEETLKKMEANSAGRQGAGGVTKIGADNAGVQLYAQASNVTALANTQDRLERRQEEITIVLSGANTATGGTTVGAGTLTVTAGEQPVAAPAKPLAPEEKVKLEAELKDVKERIDNNGKLLTEATTQAAKQVKDDKFIAGFGSNGGEEFLSYLHLGEGLMKKGGDDWKNWDAKISANLNNIQNKDGSWAGHHCITGRTFCTSAALLVLMIDRETTSIGDQIKKKG